MARPCEFSQEIGDQVCAWLASGQSLNAFCRVPDNPAKSTVLRWVESNAEFRDQYARARVEQAEYWAEEILEIADDGSNDWETRTGRGGQEFDAVNHEVVNRSRLRVDARKWLLSKLLPKKFGDDLVNAGEAKREPKTIVLKRGDTRKSKRTAEVKKAAKK
jgi:hypothetical protein